MGKTKATVEVSEGVEQLFAEIEQFVTERLKSYEPNMKIQIEKDFRGKPVLAVRVRKEGVEFELMPTLRYPEL